MLFQDSPRIDAPTRLTPARRVWDGFVKGIPDCWVVVARDERDLFEWFECEEQALEAAPLRLCRAILDDGVLLIAGTDPEEDWL